MEVGSPKNESKSDYIILDNNINYNKKNEKNKLIRPILNNFNIKCPCKIKLNLFGRKNN